MKKLLSIVLSIAILLTISVSAFAQSVAFTNIINVINHDGEIKINVEGKELTFDDRPFVDEHGRTQIPVREFCEQLGCSVNWYEETRTVSVSAVSDEESKVNGGSGGDSVWFTIGEKIYRKNAVYYEMDTKAQLIGGRTYVPLRYLAEAMSYNVKYNQSSDAALDEKYGYAALDSFLGLGKELVFDKMDIDESYMLKSGDESYPIRQNQEGNMYIIKNGYKEGHVILEFYNDILYAFHYILKTEGEAFDEALEIYDYFVKLYGTESTYPGIEHTIAKIEADESINNEEVCSYYDEWHIDAPKETIKTLLGDVDNALMKMLRLEINPRMSVVRVNYSKDLNFHNRSILKITDKDNNYIITDGDVLSCEVRWLPRPEDGPSAGVVSAVALELKITDEARADFKEATKRISEYPDGENYFKCIVDGVVVSTPMVATQMDTNEILISAAIENYETFNSYADKINAAIK